MKKIFMLFCILNFGFECTAKDSTINISASIGSYTYFFNNVVSNLNFQTRFRMHRINPFACYAIGGKIQKNITPKKQFTISLLYSNAFIGYLYVPDFSKIEQHGDIQLNALVAYTVIQYQAFQFLKLNYGLSHYFNLVNRFDNPEIAKEVNWYDQNGKSRMMPYTIALTFGAEIKIYKRLSIEFNTMRGLNNFVILSLVDDPTSGEFPEKLRYSGLTLNYRLR